MQNEPRENETAENEAREKAHRVYTELAHEILDIANDEPMRYVGAGHYAIALMVHPYLAYRPFDGADKNWATSFDIHERFAEQVLSTIEEEIKRLQHELNSNGGTPSYQTQCRGLWALVVPGYLWSTRQRICRVAKLLNEELSDDDKDIVGSVDYLLSKQAGPCVQGCLGLEVEANDPFQDSLRRMDEVANKMVSGMVSGKPFIFCHEDIQCLQDIALYRFEEVRKQWNAVEYEEQYFDRDDVAFLRLFIQRRKANLATPSSRLEADQALENRLVEVLSLAPSDWNGPLISVCCREGNVDITPRFLT